MVIVQQRSSRKVCRHSVSIRQSIDARDEKIKSSNIKHQSMLPSAINILYLLSRNFFFTGNMISDFDTTSTAVPYGGKEISVVRAVNIVTSGLEKILYGVTKINNGGNATSRKLYGNSLSPKLKTAKCVQG